MLYALPDHEVMDALLPGIAERKLPIPEAVAALRARPGLVPIAICPAEGGRVYFADIGQAPFVEWKFIYTIERLAKEGAIEYSFTTPIEVLDGDLPIGDALSPDGLIFHVSRCGSTLFCKALARLPENLIINQAGPLQHGFWSHLTDQWRRPLEPNAQNLRRFRNLVLLMTRRRGLEYRRCFIKFISWNVAYMDFIVQAFPNAPALYLYRDPAEIIAIVLRETTAALRARGTTWATVLSGLQPEQTSTMGEAEFLAHCYAHYFDRVIASAGPLDLRLVNYRQLRQREAFERVLAQGFGWQPAADPLAQMQSQYDYYSKDDSNRTRYRGEHENLIGQLGPDARAMVDSILGARLEALDQAEQNLFSCP